MLSATCLDPFGDSWGSDAYEGEWKMCNQQGDGTCTPWGMDCYGNEDTATKCPLDFGGSGDGCQPPNLITTLINIALNPGAVDEPMYAGQAGMQNILLLCALISVPILLLPSHTSSPNNIAKLFTTMMKKEDMAKTMKNTVLEKSLSIKLLKPLSLY